MNILVCIKPIKKELVSESVELCEKYCINPYDLFALNEAMKVKKNASDATIECVCMGENNTKEVLKRCLAKGADAAYLLSDSSFAGSDTIATSYILSKFIETKNYDYIFCGSKSVDGETGQVVFGLSERLGFGCVTKVVEITEAEGDSLTMLRSEESCDSILRSNGKTVVVFDDFSIETSISLIAMKRANRCSINILTGKEIGALPSLCGQKGSRTQIIGAMDILEKRECQYISGDIKEQAQFLDQLIRVNS
jgi:Electron transfer flavoprotein, beta subunit